jgi:hypothetical protein
VWVGLMVEMKAVMTDWLLVDWKVHALVDNLAA